MIFSLVHLTLLLILLILYILQMEWEFYYQKHKPSPNFQRITFVNFIRLYYCRSLCLRSIFYNLIEERGSLWCLRSTCVHGSPLSASSTAAAAFQKDKTLGRLHSSHGIWYDPHHHSNYHSHRDMQGAR